MKRSFAQLQAKGARQVRGSSLPVAQGIPVSLPTQFPAVGAPSADWRLKSLYLFEAPQRSIDAWNRHDALPFFFPLTQILTNNTVLIPRTRLSHRTSDVALVLRNKRANGEFATKTEAGRVRRPGAQHDAFSWSASASGSELSR
jgi:hypothetical protein